jgi:ABC-type phosphate/phosphonate transport system substrate-binding protein
MQKVKSGANQCGRNGIRMWCVVCIMLAWLHILAYRSAGTPGAAPGTSVTVGFTSAMISEMNRNDAAVSIKAIAEMIIRKRSIQATPQAAIYDDLASLRKALKTGEVEVVSLRVDEFLEMEADKTLEPAFVGVRDGSWAEEYLLLAHAQDPIINLSGLRAKSLIMYAGRRTGLARIWLDSLLRASNLPEASQFFGEIKESTKLSKAVLPVFFKQGDACLVTRSGFKTMVTLNPQVGKQLVIIKESPLVLPSLTCIRRNMEAALKDKVIAALGELHNDSAGQQALTLFSLDRLIPCTKEHIQTAIDIMEQYRSFKRGSSGGIAAVTGSSKP